MPPPVPVVLCIDVEPSGEHRPATDPGPWPRTVAMHAWLAEARERIAVTTGHPARFAWFLRMDPQMEALFGSASQAIDVHPELRADAEQHGDELGLHIHAWRRSGDEWVDDLGDPAWVDQCIDDAFGAYAAAFGSPCRVTRMGFRVVTDRIVARLGAHGVEVDLSPEAAHGPVAAGGQHHVTAALPDERRTPRGPHRRGGSGPVFLPLSATRRQAGLRHRLWGARRYGWSRLDQPLTLRHEVPSPDSFADRVERSVRAQRRPYLAFAVHSGNTDDDLRARLDRHLDELLAGPLASRLVFTTPRSAWAMLSG